MSFEIEIEFKNLLTEKEFQKLRDFFQIKEDAFVEQMNYYFDTPHFLIKKNGSALRIREKNGKYELTLKEPNPIGLLESSEPLNKEEFENFLKGWIPDGEIKEKLISKNIPIEQLSLFGTLKTKRAEVIYKSGKIVLDESSYLNKKDFELEYEVDDFSIGQEEFHSLLESLEIPVRKTVNKIQRLYDTLYK